MTPIATAAIIRQPEVPFVIRSAARQIADHIAPYESIASDLSEDADEQLAVTSILREEGVLSADFMKEIEKYALSVSDLMTSFRKNGSNSKIRRQMERTVVILSGWSNELLKHNRPLAAHILEDAFSRSDLAVVEFHVPHPTLRPFAPGINLPERGDPERMRLLSNQLSWINFRDEMVMNTWRTAIDATPSVYKSYAADLIEILDANLAPGPEYDGQSVQVGLSRQVMQAAGIRHLSVTIPEKNPFWLINCEALTTTGQVRFGISRFNGELIPEMFSCVSARGLFAPHNEPAYDTLRLNILALIYDCLTNGILIVEPWLDESMADDPSDETEILLEEEPESFEPEPSVPFQAEIPAPVTPVAEAEPPVRRKTGENQRGRLTWRRVIRTLKGFGVTVEWNDHPMLCRDGKRVRYPNPHDTDVKTNARYLHHALRAFGIPREEFYAKL